MPAGVRRCHHQCITRFLRAKYPLAGPLNFLAELCLLPSVGSRARIKHKIWFSVKSLPAKENSCFLVPRQATFENVSDVYIFYGTHFQTFLICASKSGAASRVAYYGRPMYHFKVIVHKGSQPINPPSRHGLQHSHPQSHHTLPCAGAALPPHIAAHVASHKSPRTRAAAPRAARPTHGAEAT